MIYYIDVASTRVARRPHSLIIRMRLPHPPALVTVARLPWLTHGSETFAQLYLISVVGLGTPQCRIASATKRWTCHVHRSTIHRMHASSEKWEARATSLDPSDSIFNSWVQLRFDEEHMGGFYDFEPCCPLAKR